MSECCRVIALSSAGLTSVSLPGALSLTALLNSSPVLAARYEVIDPKAAVLNVDTKDSQEVKEGREAVNTLIATVAGIKADLAKDGQIDLSQRIKDDLSISKARIAFNKVWCI